MARYVKKIAPSDGNSGAQPKTGNLKERLTRLPSDQLLEIVEKFLTRLDEKQRLEFLDFLSSAESQDREIHLPYRNENLVQAHEKRKNFRKVFLWADRGLKGRGNRNKGRNAILADHKARATTQLGDPMSALSALWDAFSNEADVERYVALREAAIAAGKWDVYYPQIVERLTHDFSRKSYSVSQLWDNRLLVEARLVEGEYEQALKQASQHDFSSWAIGADARKSVVDFFLHSVTSGIDITQYPEITRRLRRPAEFIKRLGAELFQNPLSDADRNRRIDWMVQLVAPRIDEIVVAKRRDDYSDAALDAKFIVELYSFGGRNKDAQSFIASLHTKYQYHRNFRAEMKKLGLV